MKLAQHEFRKAQEVVEDGATKDSIRKLSAIMETVMGSIQVQQQEHDKKRRLEDRRNLR